MIAQRELRVAVRSAPSIGSHVFLPEQSQRDARTLEFRVYPSTVHRRAIAVRLALRATLDALDHLRVRELQQLARLHAALLDPRDVLGDDALGNRQRSRNLLMRETGQ